MADTVVCVLDITAADTEAVNILYETGAGKALRDGKPSVVFYDKMPAVEWSHSAYEKLVTDVQAALQAIQKDEIAAICVPISSADGGNFLDLSEKSTWYSSGEHRPLTVLEAIDY